MTAKGKNNNSILEMTVAAVIGAVVGAIAGAVATDPEKRKQVGTFVKRAEKEIVAEAKKLQKKK